MSVWVVRAGRQGQFEQLALDIDSVVVGWRKLPDLSGVGSRQSVEELVQAAYPDNGPVRVRHHAAQLWTLKERIKQGDLVVLPLRRRTAIALGRVKGSYCYRTDLSEEVHHTRPVQWIRTDVPRTHFDRDLLNSFGAMQTVFRIQKENAESRILAIAAGEYEIARTPIYAEGDDEGEASLDGVLDLAQAARDELLDAVCRRFQGHAMADLVDAVLRAQGYQTRVSPPGPDGGVDVLAGRGALGLDAPRLCVQVKSGRAPVGVRVLRELGGVVRRFGADQGLLVSWGGFTGSVLAEAAAGFFSVRLWDAGDLLDAVLAHYDELPRDVQALLPARRVWTLVHESP